MDNADLKGALMRLADLNDVNLSGANLSNANLSSADLISSKGLTQTQLDQACGTEAKLDPGLTLKPCRK